MYMKSTHVLLPILTDVQIFFLLQRLCWIHSVDFKGYESMISFNYRESSFIRKLTPPITALTLEFFLQFSRKQSKVTRAWREAHRAVKMPFQEILIQRQWLEYLKGFAEWTVLCRSLLSLTLVTSKLDLSEIESRSVHARYEYATYHSRACTALQVHRM